MTIPVRELCRIRGVIPVFKHCHACAVSKPISEFSRCAAKKDGLQTQCKACKKAYKKTPSGLAANAQYENKPSRRAQRKIMNAAWVERNREYCRSKSNQYYAEHKHTDAWRESNKRSYVRNKHVYRARDMRRIAVERCAVPAWLTRAHFDLMKATYRQVQELTHSTGIPHEVDHIVPLLGKTVRGLHVPWNLRVVPREVNRNKSNRLSTGA